MLEGQNQGIPVVALQWGIHQGCLVSGSPALRIKAAPAATSHSCFAVSLRV
jgi:hypothetical protein